jgi:chaperonin GroEL (HSP60 family)
LLAAAIYADGVRNIAAGASAIELKRGLDRGLRVVVTRLKELSRPVSDHKQRVQVATVSAHNDETIGEIVASALERVGLEGTTSVEEAKGTETTVEVVEGMQFDRGYLSVLRDRGREDARRPGRCARARHRQEDSDHNRAPAGAGADCQECESSPDHRRGHRR